MYWATVVTFIVIMKTAGLSIYCDNYRKSGPVVGEHQVSLQGSRDDSMGFI